MASTCRPWCLVSSAWCLVPGCPFQLLSLFQLQLLLFLLQFSVSVSSSVRCGIICKMSLLVWILRSSSCEEKDTGYGRQSTETETENENVHGTLAQARFLAISSHRLRRLIMPQQTTPRTTHSYIYHHQGCGKSLFVRHCCSLLSTCRTRSRRLCICLRLRHLHEKTETLPCLPQTPQNEGEILCSQCSK